ncbi:MAG TPA: HsdR family type I site-specific deoxyribonuclease [Anaerolineales bacterium]|nr:HsdR family type I site-specific deoxyribonuclease [Anaerolineales bacterium]
MFNEQNTVENYLIHLLTGTTPPPGGGREMREEVAPYIPVGRNRNGAGWYYVPSLALPRRVNDVLIEQYLREALIRLNPEIKAQPEHAEEVLYKLRAIVLSVRSDGLVRANEEFTAWLRGDRSMPFGKNNEHVTVKLIDYDDLDQNQYVATTQYTFRAGSAERRADLMLFVNGLPLILVEAKTPVRRAISWFDGARQVHDDYERFVPELFACNVFSVATEGKDLRYGAIHVPLDQWGPWLALEELPAVPPLRGEAVSPSLQGKGPGVRSEGLSHIAQSISSLLRSHIVLDILAHFTLFATDRKNRRIKVICRYQQYDGANKIVERVVAGYPRKGLIWHFQGSGKSLLMVFAAQKMRLNPALRNPTVLIIVDRIDLDTQISATFHAPDIPNLVKAESRQDLETLLRQDTRKIIITTIFKFAEADGVLNDRHNIIAMVDEAHRTQEGDLGVKMRTALPNAFLFGLTGTPINRRDRNTFVAFGADEDEHGYMSRYGFEESIRDGATLPLHFEPRLLELRINKQAIDDAYAELTGSLTDLDREGLTQAAARMAVLVKVPDRIDKICADIAHHYLEKVRPNGFKAMVVTFDQESCLLYRERLISHLLPDSVDVVISVSGNDPRYTPYRRDRDTEEKLLNRFRDPNDPLQILIVTAKLLTGFDAPILQAMYLDKPMRDHTLLQAITRTNRTYGDKKTHGLIVDYLGVFDDVAKSLQFDEEGFRKVVDNVLSLKTKFPEAIQKCLAYFPDVDRTLSGYEGLIAAHNCLPGNDLKDSFAADYSYLSSLWEAISPDPMLGPYETDYRWLSQIYISIQPSTGQGGLIWHALGAKTIELIHQNIHVEAVRDDLDEIVLDSELLDAVLNSKNPEHKAKELQIKLADRLRKHMDNSRYRKLSERLEQLKERHEAGQLHSLDFLKALLDLARDLVNTEKEVPPAEDEDRGKAALTELFQQTRTTETPIVVERIVDDIDDIVRKIRFEGWQATDGGKREVRKALRRTLFKYKLHADTELFEKAYGYVKEYY